MKPAKLFDERSYDSYNINCFIVPYCGGRIYDLQHDRLWTW